MGAKLILLLIHFSMSTGNWNFDYDWCQESRKVIDFQEIRSHDDFKKEAQYKCEISLIHIPNSTNLTKLLLEIYTPQLNVLKVSDGIDHIDEKFFRLDLKLMVLDLSGNRLHHLELPNNNSSYPFEINNIFDSLNTLNLSQNNFSSISFMQRNSALLVDLDLSQNLFEEVPVTALKQFRDLMKLTISKNKISKFQEGTDKMPSLLYLDVSFNNLKNLNGLENFVSLKVLYLGNNVFKIVNRTLLRVEIWSLEELFLDNDEIEEVTSDAFGSVLNLLKLNLSHNKITKLHPDIFSTLQRLKSVDISHNFLTKLDGITSRAQKNLLHFNFRDNRIRRFDYVSMVSSLPSLQEIDILDNQFNCDNLQNMFSFFVKKGIYVIGIDRCILHDNGNNIFCCEESNLTSITSRVGYISNNKSEENSSQQIDSLSLLFTKTSQNISDSISLMEKNFDALSKLLLYQFGFIVIVSLIYVIFCIFRYCGKKNYVAINKTEEVHEVKVI